MNLSDPVSSIMQTSPISHVIDFKALPVNPDPDFFFDLKNHLQTVESYRKERKAYYKLHPGWSLYRARDEFAREYPTLFYRDIECFVRSKPHMNAGEAAQAFCNMYRGYYNVYGLEMTERAFRVQLFQYTKGV